MKAIFCTAFKKRPTLEIKEVSSPKPKPNQILIKNEAWGVNYVDYLMCQGGYQLRPEPPFVPGIESAGRIIALGDSVRGFSVGDPVMAVHRPGGFAEEVAVTPESLIPIPQGMNMEEAATFRSAFITAYHGLVQGGRLQTGETVLIHGAAGGTGHAAVQVAKMLGAQVIASATGEEKHSVLRSIGADYTIDYQHGFYKTVKDLTDGRGADVIFDPVGGGIFEESMRCLNWGARIVVVGFTSGRKGIAKTNLLLIKGATVTGIRAGEFSRRNPETSQINLKSLLSWAAAGNIRPHISHRFPIEDLEEALRTISQRRVIGKTVLSKAIQSAI